MILLVLAPMFILIFSPRIVLAEPSLDSLEDVLTDFPCAYVTRTPTQADIDLIEDAGGNNPLVDTLKRKKDNGKKWLYIYCRPNQRAETVDDLPQFILSSDDFMLNSEWQFASLLNSPSSNSAGIRVSKDKLDRSVGETEPTIGDTEIAEDFVDRTDDDADGVPDPVEAPEAPGSATAPPASTDDSEPKCEDSFDFPGAWLVCLVLSIVDSSVDSMVNAIADMLQVGRAEINDDGLKEAWSYFRNIASVLLVVIGLVMIIGQAVSKE